MKKRLLAAMLVLTMVAASLSACGSSSDSGSSASTDTAGSSAGTENAGASENAENKTEDTVDAAEYENDAYAYIASLPKLSDEKVNYTLVAVRASDSQIDFNDMEFFKALEEATNVHIDFVCYVTSAYADQKNLMLASGDYYDGFFGYEAISMSDLITYGEMGMFLPINDLIDQYCPNYKAVLEETPVLDGLSTAFDGNKYSWGSISEADSRDYPDLLYINKTWLDNLGLDMPTTMEEYFDVLTAFKEQDANGNGDPNDEIPYTFVAFNHITGYGSFFGAYGEAQPTNGGNALLDYFVVGDDDSLIYTPITDEYYNSIIELRKFVEAGLWDTEGFVQDGTQFSAKLATETPTVGSAYCWSTSSFGPTTMDQYVPLPPLKATADSDAPKVHQRKNHISVQATGLALTEKCKNPEILAQWVDLFYDPVISILANKGLDNVTEIDEDGNVHYDNSLDADGVKKMQFASYYAPGDEAPKNLTSAIDAKRIYEPADEDEKQDTINKYYKPLESSVTLPAMNYKSDEQEWLNDYGLNIQEYVRGKQTEWLMGTAKIEDEWDSYLAQLKSLGLDEFLERMQTVYNRTIAAE